MNYLYRLGWWSGVFMFFNVIVLISVEISIFLIKIFARVKDGEDVIEPFVLLILLAVINLFYILMALFDVFDNTSNTQSRTDKVMGLAVTSIVLFIIPAVIHFASFVWSTVVNVFT